MEGRLEPTGGSVADDRRAMRRRGDCERCAAAERRRRHSGHGGHIRPSASGLRWPNPTWRTEH
eukprot:1256497-Prymnesium_polylepis.1